MAENELGVIVAGGATEFLRSQEVEPSTQIHGQVVFVVPFTETPVDVTGGTVRHSVTSGAAVALDDPTAHSRLARIRVRETTDALDRRLYYRTDGTNPTNDGANAFGYFKTDEVYDVRIPTKTNFKMIASGGTWEVYVEWLKTPSS